MTRDSIGLGEDGPTHQPIEQLASLRAMPDLLVFRPADGIETAECWELALNAKRSNAGGVAEPVASEPPAGAARFGKSLGARGGYVFAGRGRRARCDAHRLRLGGAIALRARRAPWPKAKRGRHRLPAVLRALRRARGRLSRARFWARRPASASKPPCVSAGTAGSAERSAFIGMSGFGASAPAEALYAHFGITPEAVAKAAVGVMAGSRPGDEALILERGSVGAVSKGSGHGNVARLCDCPPFETPASRAPQGEAPGCPAHIPRPQNAYPDTALPQNAS